MLLKLFLPALAVLLVAVLMAHLRTPTFAVPLRGNDYKPQAPASRANMPPIDRVTTAKVETATFAMG